MGFSSLANASHQRLYPISHSTSQDRLRSCGDVPASSRQSRLALHVRRSYFVPACPRQPGPGPGRLGPGRPGPTTPGTGPGRLCPCPCLENSQSVHGSWDLWRLHLRFFFRRLPSVFLLFLRRHPRDRVCALPLERERSPSLSSRDFALVPTSLACIVVTPVTSSPTSSRTLRLPYQLSTYLRLFG